MILICSVCGQWAKAKRHWWNQDRGYGVCPRCFAESVRVVGVEQSVSTYGRAGLHHSVSQVESVQEFLSRLCR